MTHDGGMDGFALVCAAPAKLNLALHVVGQRPDGYHLLESLVTFADRGDRIGMSPAPEDRFSVSGRFAGDVPTESDVATSNLVLKARDLLRSHAIEHGGAAGPVHLHLEKNLPVASGIGGGSADAAATLLGLAKLWNVNAAPQHLLQLALSLGADVPMCVDGRPLFVQGIGEKLTPVPLPTFPLLLINPLVGVSTPDIFRALTKKHNPPLKLPAKALDTDKWIAALGKTRNDLARPALKLQPVVGTVMKALKTSGAPFVQMSGSGATCFGIFRTTEIRDAAAATLSAAHPHWYVCACNSVGAEDDHGGN